MKHEPKIEIFHQAFSSRTEIAANIPNALLKANDLERLKKAHIIFNETVDFLSKGEVEDKYRAFSTAIKVFLLLADWKHSIRNAESDAQRFLNSAKLISSELDKTSSFTSDEKLTFFLDQVGKVKEVGDLDAIQDHLKIWTLPLLLFANIHTEGTIKLSGSNLNSNSAEKLETTVAFLKFDIDGTPAKQWNYLKPNTSYDLTIEVRVSNWPLNVNILLLTPVTIDQRERNWLPSFRFQRPEGNGPFTLTGTKRAALEIAHSFGSRPYEFLYAAEFEDAQKSKEVVIVGHRRLLIEGSDVASHPLTGFTNVDRHLLTIRDKLRTYPGLLSEDLANVMVILAGLGNIAAQATRDAWFSSDTSEKLFQQKTTEILRSRSDIGEELQSHPGAAGGITDLTFRDINIELKVENKKSLFPKDCSKFFGQTAAYAIALGKRIGVLCVLDTSQKSNPIGIIEDDIEVMTHKTGNSQMIIVIVVVRGGFPKPSSYSKK